MFSIMPAGWCTLRNHLSKGGNYFSSLSMLKKAVLELSGSGDWTQDLGTRKSQLLELHRFHGCLGSSGG